MTSESNDNSILSATCENLGSVLNPKAKLAYRDPLLPFSPIHAALNLLSKFQHIEFKFAQETIQDTTLEEKIDRIARRTGVDYRSIALSSIVNSASPIPLLGFYGKDRKSVVLQLTTKGCLCHDPKTQKSALLNQGEIDQLDPLVYQFYRPLVNEPNLSFFKMLKGLLKYYLHEAGVALGSGFLYTLATLFTPFAIKVLFDTVLKSGDVSFLFQLSLGLIVTLAASALFILVQRYTISRLRTMTLHDLQLGIWGKVLRSSAKLLRKFSVGEIFEKIDYFARNQQLLGEQSISAVINILFSLFYLGVMLYFSWPFTLGAVLIITVSMLIASLFISIFLRLERKFLPLDYKLVSKVVQFIRGIRTIRTTDSEDRFFASWANSFIPTQVVQKEMGMTKTVFACIIQISPFLITLMVYVMAVIQLEKGETTIFNLSLGDYLAFVFALNAFVQATYGAFGYYFELMVLIPSWNQAKEVLDIPPESTYVAPSRTLLEGSISLENLHFAYQEERPILSGIDLAVKQGEFIGIVGPTGCGKSTLLRLLIGLESPDKGEVYYDGKELAEWDLKDLRSQIGCVFQNTTIFEGSIFENIAVGRRIDEKKVNEVIKVACLDEFVAQLPMGLHTALSYGGTTISMGQKQRVLIARALVDDPRVILFDEATSALDNQTQKIIMDNLEKLNVTRIIVAHRRSTLMNADRIYSIEDGLLKPVVK